MKIIPYFLVMGVAKVVQEWADKHGIHPRFHGVTNIKEIKARWVSEYEFEILEPEETP